MFINIAVLKLTENSPKISAVESLFTEAVSQRCSVKNVFLKISQISQENTCARDSFLIKLHASGEFCKISKNTFSHRTTPVAASVFSKLQVDDPQLP